MITAVRVHPKVDRQLIALGSRVNAPATAAMRARKIIGRLARGEAPAISGRMRPKRDKRIKNGLKFNLGKGFRLICIQKKGIFYILFVGDHDSADAWLDRYSRKKPLKKGLGTDLYSTILVPAGSCPGQDESPVPDKELGPPEIPQHMLRRVFRGLCPAG